MRDSETKKPRPLVKPGRDTVDNWHVAIPREVDVGSARADLLRAQKIAKIALWYWTVGTDDFFWSPECYSLLRIDPSTFEPTLASTLSRIHPDDRDRVAGRLEAISKGDTAAANDFRMICGDGEIIQCQSEIEPVYNEEGQIVVLHGICQDVTERRRIEDRLTAALQARTDELAAAQKIAKLGVWRWELDTDTVSWSQEMYEFHGLDPNEFKPTIEAAIGFIHEGDRERVITAVLALRAGNVPPHAEARIVRRDGGVRHCWMELKAVTDEDGRTVAIRGIIQDISERRAIEQRQRESDALFHHLVDHGPAMAWTHNSVANEFHYSKSWLAYTGLQSPIVPRDVKSIIHEDDRARVARLFIKSQRDTLGFQVEHRIRRHDGEYRWVMTTASPRFDDEGMPMGVVGSTVDIHDRHLAAQELAEAEARLRQAIDLNPQKSWVTDAQGRLIEVYDDWLRNFDGGYDTLAELSDRLEMTLHPDDKAVMQKAWADAIADGEGFEVEVRSAFRAKTHRWVRIRAAPHCDEAGTVIQWFGTSEDIHERKSAEIALQQTEERFRLAARATNDTIWDYDLANEQIRWNGALTTQFGYYEEGAVTPAEWWRSRLHPDDRERVVSGLAARIAEGGERWTDEYRFLKADGSYADVHDSGYLIHDDTGRCVRAVGSMVNVTRRNRARVALRESEERLQHAVRATGLGIWDYNFAIDEGRWSDELRQIFGVSAQATASLDGVLALTHVDDQPSVRAFFQGLAGSAANEYAHRYRILRADTGEVRWLEMHRHKVVDDAGEYQRAIITIRDITDHKLAEERIHWTANHDALTQLPNRALFHAQMDRALAEAVAAGEGIACLVFDVDHFKDVNDSHGHDAGDGLLRNFASRLRAFLEPGDLAARMGGDEFAVLMRDIPDEAAMRARADLLVESLCTPFSLDGRMLDCRASAGGALFPDHATERSGLLKHADLALYAAKAAARGRVAIYRPEMSAAIERRSVMISTARTAIDDHLIFPHYQPVVELASGKLAGFEALLRWQMPGEDIQGPDRIAGAFDEIDLATAMGDRMIGRIIANVRDWLQDGVEFGHVAINASPAEFRSKAFGEGLVARLAAADIPTHCIVLEVTETVFVGRGAEHVGTVLRDLSKAGVRIALDDFGTGFASLSHLKQFPVDIIKIDRSFVRDLEEDPDDAAIVRAVLNLGQSLDIKIVAEGVENPIQAVYLKAQKCDYAQGFLFGRSIPPLGVPRLISQWQHHHEDWDLQALHSGACA